MNLFVLETATLKFVLKPRMPRAYKDYKALEVYKQETVAIKTNSVGLVLRL